jgi:hypothetical protein
MAALHPEDREPSGTEDAHKWLMLRGLWLEQLSSRVNVGATGSSPMLVELFAEYGRHILSKHAEPSKMKAPASAQPTLVELDIQMVRNALKAFRKYFVTHDKSIQAQYLYSVAEAAIAALDRI